ncbi:MAG: cobalamin-dependent protein [Acidimicrobiia bacterium]|nr:cobalamin-dependent protein [Acidimicrobiia bacterium]
MEGDEELSLRDAAERLGVHYMTAYRYVRLGRLPARRVGREWQVRTSDLEALLREARKPERQAADDGSSALGRTRWETHRARLFNRLVAADEPGAMTVVENAVAAGAAPQDVYMELLAPVLRDIGDRWAAGAVAVAEEHTATSVAARIVARMGPRFNRRGRRRGTVVLAGVAGETHWLPLALLADVLRGAGWRVVDLGGDTPTGSVLDAVQAEGDDLVCVGLSVASRRSLPAAKECVAAVHRRFPSLPVLVGGPAVKDAAAARRLGADAWAPNATGAVELLAAGVVRRD